MWLLITWICGGGLAVDHGSRLWWLGRSQPAGEKKKKGQSINTLKLINEIIRLM